MTAITTRAGKGSPLTYQEVDDNFTNLNNDKQEALTAVTLIGTQTLTNKTLTSPTIAGGSADNVVIGATTPAAATFTTLAIKGNAILGDDSTDTVTINAGTKTYNNSVVISAASTKTLTLNGGAGSNGLVLDASNNVGIGTVPSNWASSFGQKAINIGPVGSISSFDAGSGDIQTFFSLNSYNNGISPIYMQTATAAAYKLGRNTHSWLIAPSGTAGTTISFTTAMLLDGSGNLGLGVTPSAWSSSTKALQLSSGSLATNSTNYLDLFQNAYDDGTAKRYVYSGFASQYRQTSGTHTWYTAVSGTAGNAIAFTTAMTLDASGNLAAAGYGFFDGWVKITQGLTKGTSNVAVGHTNNLAATTTGGNNCVFGVGLGVNTTGCDSVAIGSPALASQTTGGSGGSSNANVAIGAYALNTATTYVATFGAITGGSGYVNGTYAGVQLTYLSGSTVATGGAYPTANITVSGGVVTAVTLVSAGSRFINTTTVMTCPNTSLGGSGSGFSIPVATLSYANGNVAVGYGALWVNQTGSSNTVIGSRAATAMTTGSSNTIIGNGAYGVGTGGAGNSCVGWNSLRNCTGSNNLALGQSSGGNITTGSNNVILGSYTGSGAPISATGSGYVILSDALGTVRGTFDAAGNLGLGVTPSNWEPTARALQVSSASIWSIPYRTYIGSNYYYDSAGNKIYINSGFASEYAQLNGAHTWSGAASGTAGGTVAFATPKMTLDLSGNLGIGTTTPTCKVDAAGTIRATAQTAPTSGSGAELLFTGGSSLLISYDRTTPAFLPFIFQASTYRWDVGATANALVLNASGNLGIGASPSNPSAKLEVLGAYSTFRSTGTTSFASVWACANDFWSTPSYRGTALLQHDSAAAGTTLGLANANLGSLIFQNTSNALIYTNGGSPLIFGTGGVERARIDASGNLCVGTTSGSSRLAVIAAGQNVLDAASVVTALPANIGAGQTVGFGLTTALAGSTFSATDGRYLTFGIDPVSGSYIRAHALTTYASTSTTILSTTYTAFANGGFERARIDSSGNLLLTSAGGLGYGTGSGGAVTQITSRTTGVTINKTNGAITLVSAAGLATYQTFTVTNSTVAATDVIHVCQKSGTDLYEIHVTAVAAGSFRISFKTTGGTTTEQPVFNFAIIKAVTA